MGYNVPCSLSTSRCSLLAVRSDSHALSSTWKKHQQQHLQQLLLLRLLLQLLWSSTCRPRLLLLCSVVSAVYSKKGLKPKADRQATVFQVRLRRPVVVVIETWLVVFHGSHSVTATYTVRSGCTNAQFTDRLDHLVQRSFDFTSGYK